MDHRHIRPTTLTTALAALQSARDQLKDREEKIARLGADGKAMARILRCPDNPGGMHRWNYDDQCELCEDYATDLIDGAIKALESPVLRGQ